ncbi:MAG TPA: hypothetical protein VFU47_04805 [Armatimonadota bacterium]|nr:hypothetical protein [Armatimonadota bacterium]
MRTLVVGLIVAATGGWLAWQSASTARRRPDSLAPSPSPPPGPAESWPELNEDGFLDPHPDAALALAFEEAVWVGAGR